MYDQFIDIESVDCLYPDNEAKMRRCYYMTDYVIQVNVNVYNNTSLSAYCYDIVVYIFNYISCTISNAKQQL